jgi:hypothetical protein
VRGGSASLQYSQEDPDLPHRMPPLRADLGLHGALLTTVASLKTDPAAEPPAPMPAHKPRTPYCPPEGSPQDRSSTYIIGSCRSHTRRVIPPACTILRAVSPPLGLSFPTPPVSFSSSSPGFSPGGDSYIISEELDRLLLMPQQATGLVDDSRQMLCSPGSSLRMLVQEGGKKGVKRSRAGGSVRARSGVLLLPWILLLTRSSAFITVHPLRYVGAVYEAHKMVR